MPHGCNGAGSSLTSDSVLQTDDRAAALDRMTIGHEVYGEYNHDLHGYGAGRWYAADGF